MHYTLESLFVGIYLVVWFQIAFLLTRQFYVACFIAGFCKHFFGYWLKIQDYYCEKGFACKKNHQHHISVAKFSADKLVMESIVEGFVVLALAYFACLFLEWNNGALFFLIGATMHILAEWMGIHKHFCQFQCT